MQQWAIRPWFTPSLAPNFGRLELWERQQLHSPGHFKLEKHREFFAEGLDWKRNSWKLGSKHPPPQTIGTGTSGFWAEFTAGSFVPCWRCLHVCRKSFFAEASESFKTEMLTLIRRGSPCNFSFEWQSRNLKTAGNTAHLRWHYLVMFACGCCLVFISLSSVIGEMPWQQQSP